MAKDKPVVTKKKVLQKMNPDLTDEEKEALVEKNKARDIDFIRVLGNTKRLKAEA